MSALYGNRMRRKKGRPLVDQGTKICVVSLKIVIGTGRETEMIADPKRKPHQDDGDSDKHRRQEEALDEALENTFPAAQSKTRRRTPQGDAELITEKQVLGLKEAPRLEQVGDEHSERVQDCKHRPGWCDDSTSRRESGPD